MNINEQRLWNQLEELGKIGRQEDGSITRFPFTMEDRQAEELIAGYMKDAGLEVSRDAAGNLIGRWAGAEPEANAVICGSHYDTVQNGGRFDGSLGVLGGIEAVRQLREEGFRPRRPVLVIGFKDEEGNRFGYGMVGSKSVCGFSSKDGLQSKDQAGFSLYEAMKEAGLQPDRLESCRIPNIRCMLELHIEQGRVLENSNCSVGIVTGIAGLIRHMVTIYGESGHSGATPMEGRKDPAVQMSRWILRITELAEAHENCVATVGSIKTFPGQCNIICSHVTFSLDLRCTDDKYIQYVLDEMHCFEKQHSMKVQYRLDQQLPAAPCDRNLQMKMEEICRENHISHRHFMSGAGHDAMNFRGLCPIGMIFVPSMNGYSHRKEEFTSMEDCGRGVLVLKEMLRYEAEAAIQ